MTVTSDISIINIIIGIGFGPAPKTSTTASDFKMAQIPATTHGQHRQLSGGGQRSEVINMINTQEGHGLPPAHTRLINY